MKTKRITLMGLMGLLLTVPLLFPVTTNAAQAWYTCTIDRVGVAGGENIYARISDTASPKAFQNIFFKLKGTRAKEMLAIALTCIANNFQVLVYTDTATQEIYTFYAVP